MGINKRVSEEQKAYVIAHLNDRPRRAVAKAVGISISTLYEIIRKEGGEIDYTRSRPNTSARDIVIAEYPYMSTCEIAQKYGFSKSLVIRWARKLKLKHTPETTNRIERKCRDARQKAHNEESYKKRYASWQRTRRLEEFRVRSGMRQKTKFRIRMMPNRVRKAIWHLTNRYNYFTDIKVGGLYTIYYDKETHRTPQEQHYIGKYGFTFCQA